MTDQPQSRRAFHVTIEAEDVRDSVPITFFQNLAVYADDASAAKAAAAAAIQRAGAKVVDFEEKELYQVEPDRVVYPRTLSQGPDVFAMSGRIYVDPSLAAPARQKNTRRLVFALVALVAIASCVMLWRHFAVIDRCLDAGGCWDETRRRCEVEHQALCD